MPENETAKNATPGNETIENVIYNLGKRDAVAQVLMLARTMEPEALLLKLADNILRIDPEHPHAKFVIEKFKK